MGRPRYKRGAVDARGKLAAAFWGLPAERPFDEVSVLDVVRRAGVNKSTFYYHFANIDEMAVNVVEQCFDTGAFTRMVDSIDKFEADAVGPDDAQLNRTFERLGLIAGNHSSPSVRHLLKCAISQAWCDRYGINLEAATTEDRVLFEFTLGGVLAVIGMRISGTDDLTFREVLSFGLRDEALPRLHAIATRSQDTS